VFDEMMGTICADPGRTIADSGLRIADSQPGTAVDQSAIRNPRSTILVFSPHPDDDVISMGGTIIRLVEKGHKVHIAYMTNGNIAVFDHDAWRFTDVVCSFKDMFGIDKERSQCLKERVQHFLKTNNAGQPET